MICNSANQHVYCIILHWGVATQTSKKKILDLIYLQHKLLLVSSSCIKANCYLCFLKYLSFAFSKHYISLQNH